jgi:hypothetical protein
LFSIDKTKTFLYPALANRFLDFPGDIDKGNPGRRIEPELFTIRLHALLLPYLHHNYGKRSIGAFSMGQVYHKSVVCKGSLADV